MTRSNGIRYKLHTGSFEQDYLDYFIWVQLYSGQEGRKKEDKDEVLVFIVQEYLCLMLVSFMLDVHCQLSRVVCAQEVILR